MEPEETGSQSTDYSPPLSPREFIPPEYRRKSRHRRTIGISVVIVILLAAAGSAGYWWYKHRNSPAKNAQPTTSQQTEQKTAQTISSQTKHYDSSNFNLGFDYPADWTVNDTVNALSVHSQNLQLTDAKSQKTTGQLVMIIRSKQSSLPEFTGGNAIAVRDSEKIAYSKPTQVQRGSTYLSFLQYAKTAQTSALDGIYITGDNGYKKTQAIPLVDVSKADPLIIVTFVDSSNKPTNIAASMWDDSNFATPIKNMLESLSIQ